MAYISTLTNNDKILLTLNVEEILQRCDNWEQLKKQLESISIELNLQIPSDVYDNAGNIINKIKTRIQADRRIKINKTQTESSSGGY